MGISREYKLKSRKMIEKLMSEGKRVKAYPVHLVYLPISGGTSDNGKLKIAVSAPKRIHRKAVDRNTLKRRMRAVVRPLIPEFESFIEESGTAYACMLIYVGSEIVPTASLEPRIKLLLQRFIEESNNPSTDEQTEERASQA